MRSLFSPPHLIRSAACLAFVILATTAHADVITLESGVISYSRSNQAFVRWDAPGFDASGDFGDSAEESWTPAHACFPCSSGQLINPSVTEALSNDDANTNVGVGIVFRLDGETYISRSFDFRIDAGNVRLGEIDPSVPLTVSTTAPFAFSGLLTGSLLDGANGPEVAVALTGRGRAQVGAHPDGNWAFTLYTFESAAPIPEPGTIVLLGTAAVGLGVRLRRRGRPRDTNASA